jgi:hypothetical protein
MPASDTGECVIPVLDFPLSTTVTHGRLRSVTTWLDWEAA